MVAKWHQNWLLASGEWRQEFIYYVFISPVVLGNTLWMGTCIFIGEPPHHQKNKTMNLPWKPQFLQNTVTSVVIIMKNWLKLWKHYAVNLHSIFFSKWLEAFRVYYINVCVILKKNNNYIYINKCFWLTLLLKTSKVWGWYDFLFCFLNVSLILTKTLIYLIKNTLKKREYC